MVKAINKIFEYLIIVPGMLAWMLMLTIFFFIVNIITFIKYDRKK